MTNILNAASSVIAPYRSTKLKVDGVAASRSTPTARRRSPGATRSSGTARAVGSTVTLPTALLVASTSLIWSEVQYSYKPTIGYVVTGTLTLKDQIYMRPRLSDSVTGTDRAD